MQVTSINKAVGPNAVKDWIRDAYKTYKIAKVPFSIFALISTIIGVIPLIGAFMLPIFTAKYAEIASKIENAEDVSVVEFFFGLFSHKAIIIIGIFHILFYIIMLGIKFILFKDVTPTTIGSDIMELLLMICVTIIILIFVLVFWLAPIICLKNGDIKASSALILSFKAFVRHLNKIVLYGFWVMLIGGVVVALLAGLTTIFQHFGHALFAAIPGSLGIIFIFIWMPVLHLSAYFMYKSLFVTYNE